MMNQLEDEVQWLVDRLPLGILYHSRAAEIISCNPAAIELLGRPREELLGRTFDDLGLTVVDALSRPLPAGAYPAGLVLQTGKPVWGTVIGVTRAGQPAWLRIDAVPRIAADGGVLGVLCMLADISEQRRAEEQMQRLAGIDRQRATLRLAGGPLGGLFPGEGAVTRNLRERIAEAAGIRKLPVLILGERGTGKALVARAVHDLSRRAEGPFVAIDCTAIPAPLFESELFGHRKGAFTGAIADKPGLFQQADGGTLFLDEIAELPLDLQPKLLIAIQEHRIRQVGSVKEMPIDVRIMAATNGDLSRMMADGRFRPDLYDRLNGVQILVPSLRERREDLERYIDEFVMKWTIEEDKPLPFVEHAVRGALKRYPWPGNLRELEMTIGRMVARAQGDRITMDLVPREIAEWNPFASARVAAQDRGVASARRAPTRVEIIRALKRHRYNKTRAAAALGISRDSLKRRVKRDGIPDKPEALPGR
ncbi:MAG: sigma-54 interaction domain-containing protein [Vicinamibacterales bacterium]